jgi:hypothetical protein
MAFNGINFNFFGGSPTINNFNFAPPERRSDPPPPAPAVLPEDDDDDPAFFVSFSRESEFSLEIGDETRVSLSQSASTTIVGDPSIFAFIGQAAGVDEPEEPVAETETEAPVIEAAEEETAGSDLREFALGADVRVEARVQQFREEVFEITSGNRFSRPEQEVLSRVFQETEFEFSASIIDDETGLEINIDIDINIEINASVDERIREDIQENNGNAFGIERRLLGLFEDSLSDNLLEGRSFDSLQDLFEEFRPERIEAARESDDDDDFDFDDDNDD